MRTLRKNLLKKLKQSRQQDKLALLNELWVLNGVIEYKHKASALAQICQKYNRLGEPLEHYLYPELIQ